MGEVVGKHNISASHLPFPKNISGLSENIFSRNFKLKFFVFFSSQVLFLICRKLTSQQLVNGTEVLKWLREILICRNKFLLKNKVDSAPYLPKD